ncbi:hypothetical protein AGMMS50239_27550 [Bacteroidia bacterium]|nr:hypothetical protein AGMMS50239_27550 [Bacteroidia bacterium]
MNATRAERTELKIGDIITHVDGRPVESIVDSIKKYYPASNEAARMRNIAGDLLRSKEQTLYINYISSNQLKQREIYLENKSHLQHYIYKKSATKCYKFINENIGYISLKSIKDEDINTIKENFKNTKGIIIDIRISEHIHPPLPRNQRQGRIFYEQCAGQTINFQQNVIKHLFKFWKPVNSTYL